MEKEVPGKKPNIWGGIECTINRVADEYKDQLKYSGHYDRPGDIEAIAELGIKTVRYPVLWERNQPSKSENIDWSWTDQQMGTLRRLGITPIAGLLHHGSGPGFTNLLDSEFPYLLAAYAYEVANRYPWIEDYTPVNEPLTTARFSGLYGLWYPHHNNETSFYKMLLIQLKGIVLSMAAIRSINPRARLIQTEDLGKTYSTPMLAYQAQFENHRRLLTFDILTGRLLPNHPQYRYMLGCGIREEELLFFQEHRLVPDVMGLNYYITSERWLDESLEKYHPETHGGNGLHRYADTEVVRANVAMRGGFKMLATEIWERYHMPMAVTEAHLHCTREEQLRWFKEIWDDVVTLTDKGIDIQAVTSWAMLGSFDWDTLLTKTGTQYESGVFDIKTKSGKLRPTALTVLLKELITGQSNFHPVTSAAGWWRGPAESLINSQRQVVIIKRKCDIPTVEIQAGDMLRSLLYACRERNILNKIIDDTADLIIDPLKTWAIIEIGGTNPKLSSFCKRNELSYVNFWREQHFHSGLNVIIEHPHTIHQVNKVLDLMIDGEEGTWIFSPDVDFKYENTVSDRRMANKAPKCPRP
jgi:dTDP-4-dehydrorhamnose reductase